MQFEYSWDGKFVRITEFRNYMILGYFGLVSRENEPGNEK